MKETVKKLGTLVALRSVILVVALYNFLLVWRIARHWTLDCIICPWFIDWSFTNAPSLILVAACALRLGRRTGCFIAIVASGVVIVRGFMVNLDLARHHELLESWGTMTRFDSNLFLSLHAQHLLALMVFVMAAYLATITLRQDGIQQALAADSVEARVSSHLKS